MTSEPMLRDLRDLLEDRAAVVRDPNAGFEALAARVAQTPQRNHRWLPAPHGKPGIVSTFTAARLVTVTMAVALAATGLLAGRSLLPDPVEPLPAVTSPSPSADASVQPRPVETSTVLGQPAADSTFAATRVVYEFEAGADPFSLAEGPAKTLLYIDRSSGTAYEVERDGFRRTLVAPGKQGRDGETFESASSVARGGWFTDIIEADGAFWQWHELYEYPPHPVYSWRGSREGARVSTVAPAVPAASFTVSRWVYDVYLVDATSGDIVLYRHKGEDDFGEQRRIERPDRPAVRAVYADPVLYVLTDDGVERYVDFALDDGFELRPPEGVSTDYRAMHGIGGEGKGQLWLFDAISDHFHVYDKRDGRYLGSWAAGPDAPSMEGTTGLVLAGDGKGHVGTIAWITPEGLMLSAPTRPRLLEAAPLAAAINGTLAPSEREPGERALEFSDGSLSLQADRLRLKVGDKVFKASGKVDVGASAYQNTADLELEWRELGVRQRMYLQLVAEEGYWWIREIWTYDGAKDGSWVFFKDLAPLTRTEIGSSLTGDLTIESTNAERPRFQPDGSASIRIDGLLLTAFRPSDQPAPLTGCERPEAGLWIDRDSTLTSAPVDSPLRSLVKLTPAEIEAELQRIGLCYRFYYRWANGSEHRCSAPPGGVVEKMIAIEDAYAHDPHLVVRVDVYDKSDKSKRDPPPYGTDCEPLVPS